MTMNHPQKVQGIVLIPERAGASLSEKQLVVYRRHRENYLNWLAQRGKDPAKRQGYAHDTAKSYATINDKWHRSVWDDRGFTMEFTHDDADAYLDGLMVGDRDYSSSHLHNVKLALKAHFRFKENLWETEIQVSSPEGAAKPKDYASMKERKKLREAALEYGGVPAYHGLTPEKRAEWKRYLARRYGKPVSEVSLDDWDRANGYKYVSLFWTAMDAGLRPVEVGRARVGWVDTENAMLRIPTKEFRQLARPNS